MRLFLTQHADYLSENVVVITDETELKPTRQNIENGLFKLYEGTQEGDTIVFHYSGHGTSIDDMNSNETDNKDEVIIPVDCYTEGIITDDWLYTNFAKQIPKGVTLYCFMDCCHSGTMLDLRCNYKSNCVLKRGHNLVPTFNSEDWTHSFSLGLEPSTEVPANIYMFSGCLDSETSLDAFVSNVYQGAFTYCLLESLTNKLENGKFPHGKYKFMELLREINCRLKIHKFMGQDSQFSCDNNNEFMKTFDI
jgi:hypothetical protein